VNRAVLAGLEITRDVSRLSDQSKRRFGFGVNVRVGVHWGLVYLDTARGDFSGSAANVATWISGLASLGAVVVSDAVESLIRNDFELEARPPVAVTGVTEPIIHYRVVSERAPVG
jgi:class 3 adenylate cyclase